MSRLVPAHTEPLEADLPDGAVFKLIGAGGTGSIVGRYGLLFVVSLARKLNRSARWVIIDGDDFEYSNRERMLFSQYGNKASVLCDELLDVVAGSRVALSAVGEYLTSETIARLVHDGDTILLAVDNHATRKLLSEYCEKHLNEFCIISAGNDAVGPDSTGQVRRGTYANCQIYLKGRYESPSLTHYHPEIDKPRDRLPGEAHCMESWVSTPQNLLANLAAASAMLNALWLHLCDSLHYSELALDIADGLMRPLPLPAPAPSHKPDS
jgi:hypothetical protein